MLRLLPLIVQCGFHASLYSLNILLGYIENLKALKLDPKTLTTPTKKLCEGSYNLSIVMASDVIHIICKILMRKTRKKTNVQQYPKFSTQI